MARKPQPRTRVSGVAAALFSATQQRILSILFGQPNRTFFTNEIIELAGTGTGATLRELKKLVECRLVTVNQVGNQKHYQANADSPIFSELCSIVYKTLGIPNEVRKALQPIKKEINLALIYGSVAKQEDKADSDVDLLVVSNDLLFEQLFEILIPIEAALKRKINPTIYSQEEYLKRKRERNPFLMRILNGPTILLLGEDSDLEAA